MFDQKKVDHEGQYLSPLYKYEDEDLDHFLRKCPVLSDLREKYLYGIVLLLPGILQSSNPTTIVRAGDYIVKSLESRKSLYK